MATRRPAMIQLAVLTALSCGRGDPRGLPAASDWDISRVPAPAQPKPVIDCIARNLVRDGWSAATIERAVSDIVHRETSASASEALDALARATDRLKPPTSRAVWLASIALGLAETHRPGDARALARRAIAALAESSPPEASDFAAEATQLAFIVLGWTDDAAGAEQLASGDAEVLASVAIGEARRGELDRAVATLAFAEYNLSSAPGTERQRVAEAYGWTAQSAAFERSLESVASKTDRAFLAVAAAHAALEHDPAGASAWIELAVVAAERMGPGLLAPDLWVELAGLYLDSGDLPRARALRDRARTALAGRHSMNATGLRYELAVDAARAGERDETASTLALAARGNLADELSTSAEMRIATMSGDLARAIAIHERATGITSDAEPAMWARLQAGPPDHALEAAFRKAVCY